MSGAPKPKAAVTLVLGLGQLVAFASSFYLLGVLGDPIAADLALPPTFVFSLMSVAMVVTPLVAAPYGRWMDAHGGKGMLLLSNLVFAVGLVLLALAQGGLTITLAILVIGLGMAIGLYGTPFATLVSLYGEAARRPITGVALLGGLGSTVGWPLTLHFEQAFGWRGACVAWALAHLALMPLAALAVPKVRGRAADGTDANAGDTVVWDRRMVQMAVLFACSWFVSTSMSSHLPRLLSEFGLTPAKAAAIAGLTGLASVTVRFAEFTVLRRFRPLIATRVATLMHPLGATGLLTLGARGAPLMALGHGAGSGMLTVAKGVLPLSLYGPANYAYRSARLSRPAQIVQIGGPALYALALAQSPKAALALSAGLCLVMFAMTFGLQTHSKPQKEHAAA
ncbi:MFS transporter [Phenylobacterium sp. 58.2.17]|uniref:MFS transporter n=1 Tax=Phenylobacterium sp. 58.2.17 TaxID=2969306 RepID=UPI002263BB57|nr:MFS transporter [Phenylobacterium sp. 58.2.17]MCX7586150.1 MFS transporter [Phenylobacterium sp. 58.2.17]